MTGSDPDSPQPHRRRPRYCGTHPRRFEEKYKELAPEEYPSIVEHVRGRGQTPAGQHVPILVEEVLAALAPAPGERGVDATLGFGGHAERILPSGSRRAASCSRSTSIRSSCRRPRRACGRSGYDEQALVVRRTNFAGLTAALHEVGWSDGADFVFADLGVSSMQLDDPARGFTFKLDGPLDMRMNPARGLSAAQWLARASDRRRSRRRSATTPTSRTPSARARARGARKIGGTRARHAARSRRRRPRGAPRPRARGRDRAQRAPRVPGAAHRGQRRARRARRAAAAAARVPAPGRTRRGAHVPLGRGPPREEGVPAGGARGRLVRPCRTRSSARGPRSGARTRARRRPSCAGRGGRRAKELGAATRTPKQLSPNSPGGELGSPSPERPWPLTRPSAALHRVGRRVAVTIAAWTQPSQERSTAAGRSRSSRTPTPARRRSPRSSSSSAARSRPRARCARAGRVSSPARTGWRWSASAAFRSRSTVLLFDYEGYRVNLLDTPGHQDFSEDTYRVLSAVDSAVMLIDAGKGVQAQTEKLFQVCRAARDPHLHVHEQDGPAVARAARARRRAREGARHPRDRRHVAHRQRDVVRGRLRPAHAQGSPVRARRAKRRATRARGCSTSTTRASRTDPERALREAASRTSSFSTAPCRRSTSRKSCAGKLTSGVLRQRDDELRRPALPRVVHRIRAAARRARRRRGHAIDPRDPRFSGFIFKIQANMNRAHRDRVAFMRVCSGKFERGMVVKHPRLGRTVRLSHPNALFGQERVTLDEAYAGDVVGLVNPDLFVIGDTVHVGEPRPLRGHPAVLARALRLRAAVEPREAEGLSQGRRGAGGRGRRPGPAAARRAPRPHPRRRRPAPVRGRRPSGCSTNTRRRSFSRSSITSRRAGSTRRTCATLELHNVKLVDDPNGNLVALFPTDWELRYFERQNPGVKLLFTSPRPEPAKAK